MGVGLNIPESSISHHTLAALRKVRELNQQPWQLVGNAVSGWPRPGAALKVVLGGFLVKSGVTAPYQPPARPGVLVGAQAPSSKETLCMKVGLRRKAGFTESEENLVIASVKYHFD